MRSRRTGRVHFRAVDRYAQRRASDRRTRTAAACALAGHGAGVVRAVRGLACRNREIATWLGTMPPYAEEGDLRILFSTRQHPAFPPARRKADTWWARKAGFPLPRKRPLPITVSARHPPRPRQQYAQKLPPSAVSLALAAAAGVVAAVADRVGSPCSRSRVNRTSKQKARRFAAFFCLNRQRSSEARLTPRTTFVGPTPRPHRVRHCLAAFLSNFLRNRNCDTITTHLAPAPSECQAVVQRVVILTEMFQTRNIYHEVFGALYDVLDYARDTHRMLAELICWSGVPHAGTRIDCWSQCIRS